MKKLFNAVRKNDLETIKKILDAKPELINCVATPPPKKDNEQSLLQVANKVDSWEIAHYLIDKGIDVNYMEPDHGLSMAECFRCPVLIDAVRFLLLGGRGWKKDVEERMKLIIHLLEKGADPNKTDNRNCSSWEWAITAYRDAIDTVGDDEQKELFTALFKELLGVLCQYGMDLLNIDRVYNDLRPYYQNASLVMENLILNRDDLYGVAPDMIEQWKKNWLPIISIIKPFYMRNNPNYENHFDDAMIKSDTKFTKKRNIMSKQPNFPFDLTGYTCFSIINCPVEQAIQLLKEYPDICAAEDRISFAFQIAALPEETKWTLVRWPRPGRFYDLMNLTIWLMGYRPGLGGENPIFAALPPAERAAEGPLLARPDYDNQFGDSMLGFWQNWSFDYRMPEEMLHWIGEDVSPQEYFFNGRGHSSTGFRLEWLRNWEHISDWIGCSIMMEK